MFSSGVRPPACPVPSEKIRIFLDMASSRRERLCPRDELRLLSGLITAGFNGAGADALPQTVAAPNHPVEPSGSIPHHITRGMQRLAGSLSGGRIFFAQLARRLCRPGCREPSPEDSEGGIAGLGLTASIPRAAVRRRVATFSLSEVGGCEGSALAPPARTKSASPDLRSLRAL